MKEILKKLNETPGVEGSMVVTRDGIMVTAHLGPNLAEDVVAALSSSLVLTVQRSMSFAGMGAIPEEMVLSADRGKIFFADLGNAFLVVVTRANLRLGSDLVELRSAARKLKSRTTINI